MILTKSNNKNMEKVLGKNFSFEKETNGKTKFFVSDAPKTYFSSAVKKTEQIGNTYKVYTTHSIYEFQLLPGEEVDEEYGTIRRPISELWVAEHNK